MKQSSCNSIRRQIDELKLGEKADVQITNHVASCRNCRQFQQQQTKLLELVANIGSVQAPADFDFKLRARLVNSSEDSNSKSWWSWKTAYATVAILILFAGGGVALRYVHHQQTSGSEATSRSIAKPEPVVAAAPSLKAAGSSSREETQSPLGVVNGPDKAAVSQQNLAARKTKRQVVSVDFSSSRATVFGQQNPLTKGSAGAFPINASLQSLTVSLDDGRGNARTISFPGVSFGSQRVLSTGNQFTSRPVW